MKNNAHIGLFYYAAAFTVRFIRGRHALVRRLPPAGFRLAYWKRYQ